MNGLKTLLELMEFIGTLWKRKYYILIIIINK